MPLITWSTALSVKVTEMDNQHVKLIDLINKLHDAMRSGKANDEVRVVVDQMINYAQSHFRDEEKLMLSNKYPGYNHQKSEHDAFIKKAQEFKQDLSIGKVAVSVSVSTYLKDWLTKHIQVEDRQYGPFFNSRGIL